jgi:hypothetical protein
VKVKKPERVPRRPRSLGSRCGAWALTISLSRGPRSRLPGGRYGQQPCQARAEFAGRGQLTFPDGDNAPAESRECSSRPAVPRNVVTELRYPELEVAFWGVSVLALRVSVPETAVHNNDGSMPWENDVRAAGECGDVEPESTAYPVKNGTDLAFRHCVPTSNAGHVPASSFPRQSVCHRNVRHALLRVPLAVNRGRKTSPACRLWPCPSSAHSSVHAHHK